MQNFQLEILKQSRKTASHTGISTLTYLQYLCVCCQSCCRICKEKRFLENVMFYFIAVLSDQ